MKRNLSIGVVIAVVIAIFLIPVLVGQIAKRQITTRLANTNWPQGYKVTVESYRAGWFTSDAEIQIQQKQEILNRGVQNLQLQKPINAKLKIYHGPILLAKNLQLQSRLRFGLAIVKGDIVVNNAHFLMFSFINFNTSTDIDILNRGFTYNFSDTASAKASQFTSRIELSGRWNDLKANSQIDALEVKNNVRVISIKQMKTMQDQQRIHDNIWIGKNETQIPELIINKGTVPLAAIYNLKVLSNTQAHDDALSTSVQTQFDRLNVSNFMQMGPGKLNTSFGNIGIDAYQKFMEQLAKSKTNNTSGDMSFVGFVNNVLMNYVQLLQGTRFSVDNWSVQTPKGTIAINGYWQFPQQMVNTNMGFNPLVASMMTTTMLYNAKSRLDVTIPVELLNQLGTIFNYSTDTLHNAGWIAVQNQLAKFSLSYGQGKGAINGMSFAQALRQLNHIQGLQQQQPGMQQPVPASVSGPLPALQTPAAGAPAPQPPAAIAPANSNIPPSN